MSSSPPAANGTTSVMSREGHSCAAAGVAAAANAAASPITQSAPLRMALFCWAGARGA
jgi:hypothetical protein